MHNLTGSSMFAQGFSPTRFILVSSCLALLAGCRAQIVPADSYPGITSTAAFDIVAEADRLAERPLWPGFEPGAVPVAIHDGERTLLFRHPAPPSGFQPVPGRDKVWAYSGRYPGVTANSSVVISNVPTATLVPAEVAVPILEKAGILIHEAFHVHQREHHPGWQPNEVELFTYPVDNSELLALRRMEVEAMRRALAASSTALTTCWGRAALRFRTERFERMPAGAAGYERGIELYEGLAAYVEGRATGLPDSGVLPAAEFAPEAVRQRGYVTGAALARLLDRLSPAWKVALVQHESTFLDALLGEALAGSSDLAICEITAVERERIHLGATADVDALGLQACRSAECVSRTTRLAAGC
jgi:hypothetical protein